MKNFELVGLPTNPVQFDFVYKLYLTMYVPLPVSLRADVTLKLFIGVDPVNDPELYCPV